MTLKQLYEALLVEMNKVEAPSLLLPDFNYLVNKAVLQYINTRGTSNNSFISCI